MANIIKEKLEDGTEYQFDMDLCTEEADAVITDLYEKDGNLENFDFTATIFSLFVNSIHILNNSGWSTEDLVEEIYTHTETTKQ